MNLSVATICVLPCAGIGSSVEADTISLDERLTLECPSSASPPPLHSQQDEDEMSASQLDGVERRREGVAGVEVGEEEVRRVGVAGAEGGEGEVEIGTSTSQTTEVTACKVCRIMTKLVIVFSVYE